MSRTIERILWTAACLALLLLLWFAVKKERLQTERWRIAAITANHEADQAIVNAQHAISAAQRAQAIVLECLTLRQQAAR